MSAPCISRSGRPGMLDQPSWPSNTVMLSPFGICRITACLSGSSIENSRCQPIVRLGSAVPCSLRLVMFLDGNRSAERLNVAIDELVRSRQACGEAFLDRSRSRLQLRLRFTRNHRNVLRFERTSMAGVAGHFPISRETFFVDRQHHSHHVARDLFRFLVVFFKMILHVAIAAFHSE